MIRSMTAFASGSGGLGQHSWTWELRSVNAKGLDLRLRVPDWLDGLEAALRAELGKALSRGSVTLGLRVTRDGDEGRIALNLSTMNTVLDALAEIEAEAPGHDAGALARRRSAGRARDAGCLKRFG